MTLRLSITRTCMYWIRMWWLPQKWEPPEPDLHTRLGHRSAVAPTPEATSPLAVSADTTAADAARRGRESGRGSGARERTRTGLSEHGQPPSSEQLPWRGRSDCGQPKRAHVWIERARAGQIGLAPCLVGLVGPSRLLAPPVTHCSGEPEDRGETASGCGERISGTGVRSISVPKIVNGYGPAGLATSCGLI